MQINNFWTKIYRANHRPARFHKSQPPREGYACSGGDIGKGWRIHLNRITKAIKIIRRKTKVENSISVLETVVSHDYWLEIGIVPVIFWKMITSTRWESDRKTIMTCVITAIQTAALGGGGGVCTDLVLLSRTRINSYCLQLSPISLFTHYYSGLLHKR